jgi:endonuclease/exonuclease/phosphatase family metal-dependent hydrolase
MKISVLQWNVWYQEKADNILAFIKQTDADVICLQELTADSWLNPGRNIPGEIEALGYHAHYVVTLKRDGTDHIQMGNGILSKLPLQNKRQIWLKHDVSGEMMSSKEPRAYLEVQLKVDNKTLRVGTVHLSFAPGFSFSPEKEAEAEVFKDAIGVNRTNFIFTGDLNALPDSLLIAELDKYFQPAGPPYIEATWTTKPFEWPGFKADKLNWRLDYVYASSDVKVLSSKIIDTTASDHLPILTELEF